MWVLILVTVMHGGAHTTITQEFNTKPSCVKAGNSTKNMTMRNVKSVRQVKFTCEKK